MAGGMSDGSYLVGLLTEAVEALDGVHDSWRCEHPDRYGPCPDPVPLKSCYPQRLRWRIQQALDTGVDPGEPKVPMPVPGGSPTK